MAGTDLEGRLKLDLRRALAARDRSAVAALRTAVAAIDNAGSVGQPQGGGLPHFGKAKDVPRRELTEDEAADLLRREIRELDEGIAASERNGVVERAHELRARRTVLAAYVGTGEL